jgi:hypothetical protein
MSEARVYMKIKTAGYLPLFFILVLIPFFSTAAQSGRVKPTPSSELPVASRKPPVPDPKFVPDPNAEKYKLVFATHYYGKSVYNAKEEEAAERAMRSHKASFIEQLNKAGEQGYKLISSTQNGTALVKLSDQQYEYTWFLTSSRTFFGKDGFEHEYATLAKQGFSLVDNLYLFDWCDDPPYNPNSELPEINSKYCRYKDLFLLARVKGSNTSKQYRLAQHVPRWQELTGDVTLTRQIQDGIKSGLVPTQALSKFQIMMQLNLIDGQSEVRVITGDVQKKINELARQGYRLALINYEIAVLFRNLTTVTPVSYVWVEVTKKDFVRQLAQLQERGGVYLATYPTKHGDKCTLIFEQPDVFKGTSFTYKVLNFAFQETNSRVERKLDIDLMSASTETLITLNQLVKEGFEARALFDTDKFKRRRVSVLLERSR